MAGREQMSKVMTLKPRMSEKTYALSTSENTFVFVVPDSANKLTVARAVEAQFDVAVEDVRIMIEKGKTKRSYHKKSRPIAGKRADRKKAYVRLKKGDKIPIFAEIEEAEKKASSDKSSKSKSSKGGNKEQPKGKLRLGRRK
jgi:large subunit ribosomal protein L23